jgi:hypothetical protein
VWLLIGLAAGLAYLAQERRARPESVQMPEGSVTATPSTATPSRTARISW